MAAPYKITGIISQTKTYNNVTSDTLYWKDFQFPVTKKDTSAINHVEFSPISPYNYAVTSGARVTLYNARSNEAIRTFSRFKETAYCGSYRRDGKLLIAGCEDGDVRLFDTSAKSMLRVFKAHQGAVHLTKFTSNDLRIMTGGDDKTVRIFDIPTEKQIQIYNDHTDYVRCGVANATSPDLILTGSYDHTVKLFDQRSGECALNLDHGYPVESVLYHSNGSTVITAGGEVINIWDVLTGGKLLTTLHNHHKTITSLSMCSMTHRLMSTSLDRHVKIYDLASYSVVHTLDYPSAILTASMSKDNNNIAVGMADGLLSVRKRAIPEQQVKYQQPLNSDKKPAYRFISSSKSFQPNPEDYIVEHKKKNVLSKYDKYFKTFNYSKALDTALDIRLRTKSPEISISIMQELIRRNGLKIAMAGRDQKSLASIIRFVQKNISNPLYTTKLIDVSNFLLDIYYNIAGQKSELDVMLLSLKNVLDTECGYLLQLMQVLGSIDTLMQVSESYDNDRPTTTTLSTPTPTPTTTPSVIPTSAILGSS